MVDPTTPKFKGKSASAALLLIRQYLRLFDYEFINISFAGKPHRHIPGDYARGVLGTIFFCLLAAYL